jgi:hypothetical protein
VGLGGTERNVVGGCKKEMDAPSQWRKRDWIGSATRTTGHDIFSSLAYMEDIFGIGFSPSLFFSERRLS